MSTGLAAVCAAWLSWELTGGHWRAVVAAAILGGMAVGPLVALLGSVNLKLNHLRGQIRRNHTSLRAMTNIRPLIGGPPLDYGDWAVDPFFGKVLAQLIHRHEPNHILECGSGTSTVFMARLQRKVSDHGSVTALEHLEKYATKSERLLQDHDLQNRAQIVFAPLREWNINGKTLPWYGVDTGRFRERPIDMLIVDGPPQSTGKWARYPAAFVLRELLSEECVIVMDDGDRSEERQTAREWAEMLDAHLEYVGGPKGTYILRCGA
jgi:predicted O-methyltransferase YrrM